MSNIKIRDFFKLVFDKLKMDNYSMDNIVSDKELEQIVDTFSLEELNIFNHILNMSKNK